MVQRLCQIRCFAHQAQRLVGEPKHQRAGSPENPAAYAGVVAGVEIFVSAMLGSIVSSWPRRACLLVYPKPPIMKLVVQDAWHACNICPELQCGLRAPKAPPTATAPLLSPVACC